jgi:predicted DNA-binding protein (MmcQ/YjbR family)
MDIEKVRNWCLKKKGVTESLPFNEDTPVYKVLGKMFLLLNLNPPVSINIKCEPEMAVELRERYDAVTPGYHMSKVHWNTVELNGSVPDKYIYDWIDLSYNLVLSSLSKKEKEKLIKVSEK